MASSHHSQMHSPHYSHGEFLATNAASANVDESRQEGSPPSWGSHEVSNARHESHIPQQLWSQPAAQSDNIWANHSESMYSASTNINPAVSIAAASHDIRRYGKGNTMTASNNDIATSMSRLQLSSASQYNNYYGQEYGEGASVASMASATSSSIPGVMGVSSGSTGGNTSGWAKDGKHSYSQYPTQQQHFQYSNQPLHMPSVPPGFLSPMAASYTAAEDDSISFDSRPSKKTSFKRKGQRGGRRGNQSNSNNNNNNNYNNRGNRRKNNLAVFRDDNDSYSQSTNGDARTTASSKASSEAIRLLIEQPGSIASRSSSQVSSLNAARLPLDKFADPDASGRPILPAMEDVYGLDPTEEDDNEEEWDEARSSATTKKRDWLLRMNRRMAETPVGELDPSSVPIAAIMNAWAKTKSAQGATMVETWLKRAQQEFDTGNTKIVPSTKMYTMAGKNFVKVWS
jgi:hypothetical protein